MASSKSEPEMSKIGGDRKGLGRTQVRCLSPLFAQASVNKFVLAALFLVPTAGGFLCAIRDKLQLQLSVWHKPSSAAYALM